MNKEEYISSGLIEDYCLGILDEKQMSAIEQAAAEHTEIKQKIKSFQQSLEQYAFEFSKTPAETLKNKIFSVIDNLALEEDHKKGKLPLISKFSNTENWLRIVASLIPEKLEEPMFVREIGNENGVEHMVIWTKVPYPDEVHIDEHESFIVLKGRCRCTIGDEVIELGPGGYLSIPLYKHHDVEIIEGPVLAVVQRVKVA